MENKILIFDDIIDLEYQERIKNILTGERTSEGTKKNFQCSNKL